MGGDPAEEAAEDEKNYFNSHPRVGGDVRRADHRHERIYFNSHPRVGGDAIRYVSGRLCAISIRTPAWGVTEIPVETARE